MKHFSRQTTLCSLLTIALMLVQTAEGRIQAGDSVVGLDIKVLSSTLTTTTLFGWRYLHKPSRLFALGGVGNVGQSTGTSTGSLAYGGMYGSWTPPVADNLGVELGILAGGAGGFTTGGTTYGGVCLEPSFSISFALGGTIGLALNAAYLYIPNSTAGSGVNGGIRFEFAFDGPERSPRVNTAATARAALPTANSSSKPE